ncbi:MAG: hypothetical protein E6Q97_09330 [Desulfurellales bacterium]|nr:MAG: hypothetical protein E6Q97_09330 [Desulfurellales bacterium]
MNPTQRAAHAQQILTNPVFKESFDMLDRAYKDAIMQSKPEQIELREHLYRSARALTDVKSALTACVETGKIEKITAAKKEKARK